MSEYLASIDDPADLRALPEEVLPEVCQELRDFLVEKVFQSGGHLSTNLGSVELTKFLKNILSLGFGNTGPGVGHDHSHTFLSAGLDAKRHGAAVGRKLDCVAQEVVEDLLDLPRVAPQAR